MTQTKNITPVMEVKRLHKFFPIHDGLLNRHVGDVRAVDDVNFTVYNRETLALVGESGCGKTTIGRCIVRAFPVTSGELLYHQGKPKPNSAENVVDLARLNENGLNPYRQEI